MQRSEPHWLLSDADSLRYGTALANALRHMPIKAAQKTIDYSTLAMVAFVMETPRVVRSVQLGRQAAQPRRGPAQVFQFHPPSQPAPTATTSPPGSPPSAASGQGAPPDFAEGPYDPGGFGGDAPA